MAGAKPLSQEAPCCAPALAAGDQPEAARRYPALLLRSATPDAPVAGELGEQVLAANPKGQGRADRSSTSSAPPNAGRNPPPTSPCGVALAVISYDAFAEIVAGSSAQGAASRLHRIEAGGAKRLRQRDAEAARGSLDPRSTPAAGTKGYESPPKNQAPRCPSRKAS